MKKIFFIIVSFLSFSVSALEFNGTWSTPFFPMGYSDIYRMQGTGNYLWFITEGAICRLNMISQDILFFDRFSFNEPLEWDDLTFTVGDSDHIALYYNDEPKHVWVYNGIAWKTIWYNNDCDCCNIGCEFDELDNFSFDKKGTLWCTYDFDEEPYHELFFHNGTEWKSVDLQDLSIHPDNYVLDDSGVIWTLASSYPTSTLYRFDPAKKLFSNYLSLDYGQLLKDSQGKLYLIGDTAVYSISDNLLKTVIPHDSGEIMHMRLIDSDGNLWFTLRKRLDRSSLCKLITYDLHKSKIIWSRDSVDNRYTYTTNNFGVFQYGYFDNAIRFYKENDSTFQLLSIDSIRCSQCATPSSPYPIFSFRKNGSLLYTMGGSLCGDYIIECNNKTGRSIPLPENYTVDAFCERSDGTLLAGLRPIAIPAPRFDGTAVTNSDSAASGLYHFNGTSWELLMKTGNVCITHIFEDKKGKIWCSFYNKIVHQTDSGWELIDQSNSNLPESTQISYESSFKEDNKGNLWAISNDNLISTHDGYTWTIFNKSNSDLNNIQNSRLFVSHSGDIQLVSVKSAENGLNSEIIRATYVNGSWAFESILFPGTVYPSPYHFNQDSWGTIYVCDPTLRVLRHYDNDNGTWVILDSNTTPFTISRYLADNGIDKLYFEDQYNRIVVYNKNETPVVRKKHDSHFPSKFSARILPGYTVSVIATIPKPDNCSLDVFSLDGKRITRLFSGYQKQGTFHKIFNTRLHRGIYIVKLQLSDNSLVTRFVVQ